MTNWGSVTDWIYALSNVGIAGAAGYAAWQGTRSLTVWREEASGRRRMELAEDLLAGFYQAEQVIRRLRLAAVLAKDGKTRPRSNSETPEQERRRDRAYARIEFLKDYDAFFSAIHSKKFRAMAILGENAKNSFDKLEDVIFEINRAVGSVIYDDECNTDSSEAEYILTYFRTGPDKITPMLESIVRQAEELYEPVLRGGRDAL